MLILTLILLVECDGRSANHDNPGFESLNDVLDRGPNPLTALPRFDFLSIQFLRDLMDRSLLIPPLVNNTKNRKLMRIFRNFPFEVTEAEVRSSALLTRRDWTQVRELRRRLARSDPRPPTK